MLEKPLLDVTNFFPINGLVCDKIDATVYTCDPLTVFYVSHVKRSPVRLIMMCFALIRKTYLPTNTTLHLSFRTYLPHTMLQHPRFGFWHTRQCEHRQKENEKVH